MTKLVLGLLFFTLLFQGLTAQNQFMRTYGGTQLDEGRAVISTVDGGFLLGGATSLIVGGAQGLLVKTDSIGNVQWSRTYGGSGIEWIYSQVAYGTGYIFAGNTTSFGGTGWNWWIVRTDGQGNKLWERSFPANGNDYARVIKLAQDSSLYTTGFATGAFGGADNYIVRVNGAGNKVWDRLLGGMGNDWTHDLEVDRDTGCVIAGYRRNYSGVTYSRGYLAKLNNQGNLDWDHVYGGNGNLIFDNVGLTSDGGYVVTGALRPNGNVPRQLVIMKLDSAGNQQWTRLYGNTSFDDRGSDIQEWPGGGYLVGGYTYSYGAGGRDMLLMRVDTAGTVIFAKTYGGVNDERYGDLGEIVRILPDREIAFFGETGSFGAGSFDLFFMRTDSMGNSASSCFETSINPPVSSVTLTRFASGNSITNTNRGAIGNTAENTHGINSRFRCCPASISLAANAACAGDTSRVVVTAMDVGAGSRWAWDYDNNGITDDSTAWAGAWVYPAAGTYTIRLVVYNPCGDSTVATTTVTIGSNVNVNLGNDTVVCPGTAVILDAGSGNAPYSWSNGDSTQTVSVGPGTWSVTVGSAGCIGQDTLVVNQQSNLSLSFASNLDTLCLGDTLVLNPLAGTSPGNPLSWSWTPSSDLTAGNAPAPGAFPLTDVTYTARITDSLGCFVEDTVRVVVDQLIASLNAVPPSICLGDSTQIQVTPQQGFGPYSYQWSPPAGLSATTIPNPLGFPVSSRHFNIQIQDAFGCTVTDSIYITVVPSPTPVISGPDTACVASSPQVYSTANVAGNSYTWSVTGGNIVSGAGTNSITVNWGTGASGFVSVTVSNSTGCDSTASLSVALLPLPTPVLSGPDTLCANAGGVVYGTAASAGSSYSWTVTGGTIATGQGTNSIVVNWGAAGTGSVTLTETGPGACDSTVSRTVTVLPLPVPHIFGAIAVCENASGQLYTSQGSAGNSYSWTVTGGTITNGQGTNSILVNWGAAGTGTVSLTETGPGGCDSTAVLQVSLSPRPANQFITGPDTLCAGGSGSFSVVGGAGWSYTWSVSGGIISSGAGTNQVNVNFNGTGQRQLTLNLQTAFGCDTTLQFTVFLVPEPSVSIQGINQLCEGTLGAGYQVVSVPGASYTWTVSGGSIRSGNGTNAILVDWGAGGQGEVQVLMTDSRGCTAADSFTVFVEHNPVPLISGPASLCEGEDLQTYIGTPGASSRDTLIWTITGGTIISGQGTTNLTVDWGTAGAGSLSFYVRTATGCENTFTLPVTIFANPLAVVNPLTASGCDSLTLDLDLSASQGGVDFRWDFGDGNVTNGIAVSHTFSRPGTYFVVGAVTNAEGCQDTASLTVRVYPSPVAAFTVNNDFPPVEIFYPDGRAAFQNLSQRADAWVWELGDGAVSTLFSPVYFYAGPGTYPVVLTAVNTNTGCRDTTSGEILVFAEYKFFIPNAFSPNGDDLNDTFYLVSENVLGFEIRIWDRWGKLIYQTNDVNFQWDGSYQGQPVPEGAYVWQITGQDLNDNPVKAEGTVMVLR